MSNSENTYLDCPSHVLAVAIFPKLQIELPSIFLIHLIFLYFEIGTENMMRYLISKGADVHAKDKEKSAPLHFCAKYGNKIDSITALFCVSSRYFIKVFGALIKLRHISNKIIFDCKKKRAPLKIECKKYEFFY